VWHVSRLFKYCIPTHASFVPSPHPAFLRHLLLCVGRAWELDYIQEHTQLGDTTFKLLPTALQYILKSAWCGKIMGIVKSYLIYLRWVYSLTPSFLVGRVQSYMEWVCTMMLYDSLLKSKSSYTVSTSSPFSLRTSFRRTKFIWRIS